MSKIYRRMSEAEAAGYLSIPMNTLIVYHARPDGDTVGCAIALSIALNSLGSRAYFAGVDEVPERLRFLCPESFVSAKYENLPSDFKPERIITVDAAAPELVGEIYDEEDIIDKNFCALGGNKYVINTRMLVKEVYDRMGIGDAPKAIAGKPLLSVMLEKLGRLPVEDEAFFYEGMKITPKSFDGGKPTEVIVRLVDEDESAALKEEDSGEVRA
jgi:hypothetical protein